MTDTIPSVPCAEDLIRYREGIETLLRIGSEKGVSNGLPAHAAILFELFFKHATEEVRIFCKNLSAQVFDTAAIVDRAKWALKNGVKIRVLVQETPEDSEFRRLVSESIRLAPISARNHAFNFAVMDKRAIRYEPNRKDVKATAWMNRPNLANTYINVFDVFALRSSPL